MNKINQRDEFGRAQGLWFGNIFSCNYKKYESVYRNEITIWKRFYLNDSIVNYCVKLYENESFNYDQFYHQIF